MNDRPHHRRGGTATWRLLAAPLAGCVLALSGCSGGTAHTHGSADGWHRPMAAPSAPTPRARPVPAAEPTDTVLPTVSGRFGQRASITVPKTRPSGRFVVAPQLRGDGRAAHTGDVAVVRYTAKVWRTGRTLPGPYDKGAHPLVFAVGRGATLPALDRAVAGQRAGSRVLVVAPPAAAYGQTGAARLGVSGKDTVVFVVDVVNVVAAHALVPGDQRALAGSLPQVGPDHARGTAAIAVPDRDAPRHAVTAPLVTGGGPVVKAGQTVVLQYSSAVWQTERGKDRAALAQSSAAGGGPLAVVIGRGNVLKGWDKALVGSRVGSRLLLVLPPDQAYGARPPKGIPAGASLVCVIDILAAA
ncbi:FKBP-type peptidyl-prolyl cis-trans isomerase [Streptomyces sp. NPDC001135]